jgi:hypothetical protein
MRSLGSAIAMLGIAVAAGALVPMLVTRATGDSWSGGYTWKSVWRANRFALVSLIAPYAFFSGLAAAGVGGLIVGFGSLLDLGSG